MERVIAVGSRARLGIAATLSATLLLWSGGTPSIAADAKKDAKSVHDFKVKTIEEKDYDLKQLSGKVLMIVNVASQ